jgi:glutamine synthetase
MTKNEPVILEFIWIDGHGHLRSKYKTIYHTITAKEDILDIEKWTYDGSSTFQAETSDSEIVLNPVKYCPNPFITEYKSYIVLCDTYTYSQKDNKYTSTASNHRFEANQYFDKKQELEPWYGIEQEYFIVSRESVEPIPIAFVTNPLKPLTQGEYYCGVGARETPFRKLAEKHYLYCLTAGLHISGVNAEVAPSQWAFQIGPCIGINAADELWIARYILQKLGEEFGVNISYEPKPLDNPWNGSGLHTNFSTKLTRCASGITVIREYIDKLCLKHTEHLAVYGDNSKRLNGMCETFTWGEGRCSIRIPKSVMKDGCGYFEDRRPASNADPYQVSGLIYKTCCLE